MGDRSSNFVANLAKTKSASSRQRLLPGWVFLSLTANGFLLTLVVLSVLRLYRLSLAAPATATAAQPRLFTTPAALAPELGPRHQLSYDQWVNLLAQEARVAADQNPPRLTILAGDSISLWFPTSLLLPNRNWLNQGISGETSSGLLRRLELFDKTQPETIFVMVGINDLIRGVKDDTILANQRLIIQHLKEHHPDAQIVLQSILPHADEGATWEGRERLLAIPNSRIRHLNDELKTIARSEDIYFLNLYPLFADREGNMKLELSTDGLHLNLQGYLVWRTALELYSDIELAERQTLNSRQESHQQSRQ